MTITVYENFDSLLALGGTSTGSNTSTTLNDTTKSWTTNEFTTGGIVCYVTILSGTGGGQQRTISGNTSTSVTISSAWTTTPDSTSVYYIGQKDTNWTQHSGNLETFYATTQGAISGTNAFGNPGIVSSGGSGGTASNQITVRTGSSASGDGAMQFSQKTTYASANNYVAAHCVARSDTPSNNYYVGYVNPSVSPATMSLFKVRSSGGNLNFASNVASTKTIASGKTIIHKFETQAYSAATNPYVELRFKFWDASLTEPGSWDLVYDDYGAVITAGGTGGTAGTYALGISGGGGTGATGTYTIGAGGGVTNIVFTALGSGFTSTPTLSFPSGGVTGAAATCGYDSNAGTIGPILTGSWRGIFTGGSGTPSTDVTIDDYYEGTVGSIFAQQQTILPNNSGIYYSPYNWVVNSGAAICNNNGGYFKFTTNSTTFNLVTNQGTSTQWIRTSVNGGPFSDFQLAAGANITPIAAGMTGTSTILVQLLRSVFNNVANDRWGGYGGQFTSATSTTATDTVQAGYWTVNQFAGKTVYIVKGTGAGTSATVISNTTTTLTVASWPTQPDNTSIYALPSTSGIPTEALNITSLSIDVGATIAQPTLAPNICLNMGDSIEEGVQVVQGVAANNYLGTDSVLNWLGPIMSKLNCEYGTVAFASQGVRQPAAQVPEFNASYAFNYNQVSRLNGSGVLATPPNYCIYNQGHNGSGATAMNGFDYYNSIVNLRTICGANTQIFVVNPFGVLPSSQQLRMYATPVNQGTATSGTTTSLTDTTQTMNANSYQCALVITGGTGAGQVTGISSSSGSTLTLFPALTTAPDATSTYQVLGGYNAYALQNPTDTKTHFINLGSFIANPLLNTPNAYSVDGIHPYESWCSYIATYLWQAINSILNPGGGGGGATIFQTLWIRK